MDIHYYIENNYMFRRLVMDIFRLYMEHFSKQLYKTCIWATYMGLGGAKVGTRCRICPKGWMVWVAWRVHAVTKLCLCLL